MVLIQFVLVVVVGRAFFLCAGGHYAFGAFGSKLINDDLGVSGVGVVTDAVFVPDRGPDG